MPTEISDEQRIIIIGFCAERAEQYLRDGYLAGVAKDTEESSRLYALAEAYGAVAEDLESIGWADA